ncbi:NADH-quinone oxidoreductase subunit G [Candidatus Nanopelagicus hibericus]|uniref:NADH-quinone oxidoreductase n=1 Tax=Candidatus Nanopelagicus hibericus TaxID=1884915 RepID=A0A249K7U2_9ACTN|nr:NADH-quinone oxidoreductase subunit G [Candidatus Nanopelagicus hibericus]ASY12848.1 NADH-quinone oxidoreductase subunit G [Candidatus Nanopelagicus hibericus]
MSIQELSTEQEVEMITCVIDGFEVTVPKGTLVIRAAEKLGIQIPRFCDHPLLEPAGACRQCLVDIEINGRAFPKPQASCTIPVEKGMVVKTQLTSPVADKAQKGIMELLLINHPLDCPVCDKGGECPLQNQAMSNGRAESRFEGEKRVFEKPVAISSQVLLDRERCVLCARCTRFSEQIAGDPFITLNERGALQQVGIYEDEPFDSYYSGNTVQICPVGALTGTSYRFRARPFDLVSTNSACEHCASGCAMRTDVRRGKTLRRLAGEDSEVNEEWNCDKGRWAFKYEVAKNRVTKPLIRDENGLLQEASWPEALAAAAAGLKNVTAGVLVGGRVTVEDAYGYSKFARVALNTNNIDFRARTHSSEELDFLASTPITATYKDIDKADHVVLINFEPEDESPIIFLRIYKQVKKRAIKVSSIAAFASRGSQKLNANLIKTATGAEVAAINSITGLSSKSVVLVGERAVETPGALSAAAKIIATSGAKLGWIPRRAGEMGALSAGAVPNLLPGNRPLDNASARVDIATVWGSESLPTSTGMSTIEIINSDLQAVVVGGVDPMDISPDAKVKLSKKFIVSFEIRHSDITEIAQVVFPVATVVEKNGSFMDWQGKARKFESAVDQSLNRSDVRILSMLADEIGKPINLPTVKAARNEFESIGNWDGERAAMKATASSEIKSVKADEAFLSSWRNLLDKGSLQDGEENLAGTARQSVVVISQSRANLLSVKESDLVRVSNDYGAVTLPCVIEDIDDSSVHLPRNSIGSQLFRNLGVVSNSIVKVAKA